MAAQQVPGPSCLSLPELGAAILPLPTYDVGAEDSLLPTVPVGGSRHVSLLTQVLGLKLGSLRFSRKYSHPLGHLPSSPLLSLISTFLVSSIIPASLLQIMMDFPFSKMCFFFYHNPSPTPLAPSPKRSSERPLVFPLMLCPSV